MSKKIVNKQEKRLYRTVLYVAVAAALLACLVFFVFANRQRKKSYQEAVAEAALSETEFVMAEQMQETESEAPQEQTEMPHNGTVTGALDQNDKKQTDGGKDILTEETEQESNEGLTEEETEEGQLANADLTILVLNGTKLPGVAGHWRDALTEAGYENVISATYEETVKENTVIYTDNIKKAEELRKLFPDCEVEKGEINSGISLEDGERLPEKIDLYVVVGMQDAEVD